MSAIAASPHSVDPIEQKTIKRVFWRLMPLIMIGYLCAYLDRSNVGMAATTMSSDLHFSNTVFGFGAGLFFLGYFIAEIPSNLILNKVGARRWLARILITWGIVAGLTAFVWDEWSFYGNRILLGVAEAGFFPGVVLYLTWWFPTYYRTRMQAIFQSAGLISLFIGPPLGGLLMRLQGAAGLQGWQWLFLLEALPPVIMCFVTYKLLTDRPEQATWLEPEQKKWLIARMAAERTQREAIRTYSLGEAFTNLKIWLLTLADFGINAAAYGLAFFLPMIIRDLGVDTNWIGSVTALPYICAFFGSIYWGYHSDRSGDRTWHVVGACLVSTLGFSTCIFIGNGHPAITVVALCLAVMGTNSITPVFWGIPSAMLTGAAAAGGFAMINSIGNLGGWFGPSVYGLVKDVSGSDSIGLLCLALAPLVTAASVLLVRHESAGAHVPSGV